MARSGTEYDGSKHYPRLLITGMGLRSLTVWLRAGIAVAATRPRANLVTMPNHTGDVLLDEVDG